MQIVHLKSLQRLSSNCKQTTTPNITTTFPYFLPFSQINRKQCIKGFWGYLKECGHIGSYSVQLLTLKNLQKSAFRATFLSIQVRGCFFSFVRSFIEILLDMYVRNIVILMIQPLQFTFVDYLLWSLFLGIKLSNLVKI